MPQLAPRQLNKLRVARKRCLFRIEYLMRIHVGCELRFEFPQTTPMIVMLNVHFSRVSGLERPDYPITHPSVPIEGYRDSFGNWCSRFVAPGGHFSLGTDAIVRDSGMSDPIDLNALQHQVQHLPAEVVLFLLGSRYCETDRLSDEAWRLFGNTPLGWSRVQAICDFVHSHVTFGYEHSRATRTAFETYVERSGVCRDHAHLAVTFCRCLNIPARYCTGYLTDVGLPPPYPPNDFASVDRGLSRQPLAHVRPAQQCPAHRARPHRAGPRRRGRASNPYLWPSNLVGFRVWADEVPPE